MDMDAELTVLHQNNEADGLRDLRLSQKAEELSMMDQARAEANAQSEQGNLGSSDNLPVNRGGRHLARRERRGRNAIREVAERYAHVPSDRRGKVMREKAINALLAMVLGSFGAHKFFQGKTFTGVLYAVFFWTLIPGFIGFIEGIRYAFMPMDDYYQQYFRE